MPPQTRWLEASKETPVDLADPRVDSRPIPLELHAHRSLRQGMPRSFSFTSKKKGKIKKIDRTGFFFFFFFW